MSEPNAEKVVFDEVQQKKVDELIRESMGRAAATVRLELATAQDQLTTLQAELQAAKDAATATGDVAKAKDSEIQKAKEETVAVRKQNAITEAGAKYNFYDPGNQLAKLVGDEIKWDGTRFVVLGEDGTPRV